jgi:hypothetical protein
MIFFLQQYIITIVEKLVVLTEHLVAAFVAAATARAGAKAASVTVARGAVIMLVEAVVTGAARAAAAFTEVGGCYHPCHLRGYRRE